MIQFDDCLLLILYLDRSINILPSYKSPTAASVDLVRSMSLSSICYTTIFSLQCIFAVLNIGTHILPWVLLEEFNLNFSSFFVAFCCPSSDAFLLVPLLYNLQQPQFQLWIKLLCGFQVIVMQLEGQLCNNIQFNVQQL